MKYYLLMAASIALLAIAFAYYIAGPTQMREKDLRYKEAASRCSTSPPSFLTATAEAIRCSADDGDSSSRNNSSSSSSSSCDANYLQNIDRFQFECLYSKDYNTSRRLFLQQVEELAKLYDFFNISHTATTIAFDSVGNALITDVLVIYGTNSNVLLHISGVHGPEGFAGSAVQTAILQNLLLVYGNRSSGRNVDGDNDTFYQGPSLVFVHALNPFGYAYNRRVNEDNIDINRNFLSEEEFTFVKERDPNFASYVDMDFLINPTSFAFDSKILNDICTTFKTIYAIASYGLDAIRRALVSGNYHKKDGLGFGGFKMSKSAAVLVDLVENQLMSLIAPGSDNGRGGGKVVLVDVHTGGGKMGIDSLSVSPEGIVDLRSLFPAEQMGAVLTSMKTTDKDSALVGYDLTIGTISESFCSTFIAPLMGISADGWRQKTKYLNSTSLICLTQEFGTVDNPTLLGQSLIAENTAWFHDASKKKLYADKLRDCYYLEDNLFWKRNIVRRGLLVFYESFDYLSV